MSAGSQEAELLPHTHVWEPFSNYNCPIYSEEVFISTAEGQGVFGFLLCPLLTGQTSQL